MSGWVGWAIAIGVPSLAFIWDRFDRRRRAREMEYARREWGLW